MPVRTSENQAFSDASGGIERECWTGLRRHIPLFQKNLDIVNSLHLDRSFVEFMPHILELTTVTLSGLLLVRQT